MCVCVYEPLATTMKLTLRKLHKMEDIIGSSSSMKSRVSTFDEPPLVFCNRSKTQKRSSDRKRRGSTANHEVDDDDKTKSEEEEEEEKSKRESAMSKVKKILDYDSDEAYWLGLHQDVEKEQRSVNQNIINPHHSDYDYHVSSSSKRMSKKRARRSNETDEEKKIKKRSSETDEKKKIKKGFNFECSICGRSFPTFQALGGHKSSHNKDKKINQSALAADSNDDGMNYQHYCKICNKKFATGMSLGGHMKSHWWRSSSSSSSSQVVGGDDDQAPLDRSIISTTSEASPGETNSQSPEENSDLLTHSLKILDFDLNEPYFMKDDQQC